MLSRSSVRILSLWLIFVFAAFATAFSIHRLYRAVHREIVVQSERALNQERAKLLERIHAYTEEVRRTTIADLASFHYDGLAPALRKWDDSNEIIIGTFRWDPANGFSADSVFPPGSMNRDEIPQFWREFRLWRAAHPSAQKREHVVQNQVQVRFYPTLDNGIFSSTDLGYQGENLDILTHAGHRPDPWAAWAARQNDPRAPWLFWYQAGPDDQVRGCWVQTELIMQPLRNQSVDTSIVRSELVPVVGSPYPAAPTLLADFPGYGLAIEPGDLFRKKESDARITALLAAAVVGVFLLGGAALTLYTRRERRDAERKINFVGQVSHELRTPLTSIRMYADLLGQAEVSETKRLKFANTIARESIRLEDLVERLLTLNALQRGEKTISRAPVNLGTLVEEIAEEMNSALKEAGLSLEVLLPGVTPIVLTDYSTLKQALLNLLDNTIKYASQSGVIKLTIFSAPEKICLELADSGPGIPSSIRKTLFNPFVQGGQTLTHKSPGVGLGLHIARETLRAVGADLALLDTRTGATFSISIPRADSPA